MSSTNTPFTDISWHWTENPNENFLYDPESENFSVTNINGLFLDQSVTSAPVETDGITPSHNASDERSNRITLCPEHRNAVDMFKTVGILFIVAMGLFGNSLSFIILKLQSKKSTMNLMMMILAVVDNFYLMAVFFVYILDTKARHLWQLKRNIALVARMSQFMSVWMIIVIGIIRLLAITRPLQVKAICTARRSLVAVLVVLLFDLLIHIPQFNFHDPIWKSSSFKRIYFAILYNFLLMFLVPFAILILVNFLLLKSLRSNNEALLNETKHQPHDNRDITKVVVAIISTFMVSYSGYAIVGIISFSQTAFDRFIRNGTCLHMWILQVIYTLCYINSSVNFFIYFFLRKSFRKNLKKLLPDRPSSRRPSDTSCNVPAVSI